MPRFNKKLLNLSIIITIIMWEDSASKLMSEKSSGVEFSERIACRQVRRCHFRHARLSKQA